MNLMTRVEGDPDQDVFHEKGCTFFPTMAVLDADGTLLAKNPEKRDVPGLEALVASAREFQGTLKKAAGGDAAARLAVLEKQIEWGSIPSAEGKKAVAEMTNLDADRKEKLERGLLAIEFNEAGREKDHAKRHAKLEAMRVANRIPVDPRSGSMRFWTSLVSSAEQAGDAAKMRVAIEHAAKALEGTENAQRMLDQMKARLEKLETGKKDG